MRIGFDVDNTLIDRNEFIRQEGKKILRKEPITKEDFVEPKLSDFFECSPLVANIVGTIIDLKYVQIEYNGEKGYIDVGYIRKKR